MEDKEKQTQWLKLWHRFHSTCKSYRLLEDGDKVLVGLSGGKDSLALVELLGNQARIFKPKIEVIAVHVRVENRNYLSDISYLSDYCAQWGVPFYTRDTRITGEEKKDPCFLCSWYRRKCLFEFAIAQGCNKIALGHHTDDVLETLMLNLVYAGRFDSIRPSLQLDKMPLTIIRPLYGTDEKDISSYASLCHYKQQEHLCPFETHSKRHCMQDLLERMQQLSPNVRSNLMHALERKL